MSFVNIKSSNLRFLSPQNLLVYIWTHLGQVPTVAEMFFGTRSGSSQLLKSSTQRYRWCCRFEIRLPGFDADVSAARDCTDPIVSCTTVPLSWVPREETDQRMCGRPVEHNEQMRRRSMLLLCEGKHELLEENTSSVRSWFITWFLVI